jgi:general secretion pathway protein B
MSYILEALKKSDQKRQSGKVPDLQTVPEESRYIQQKRRLWPYVVAVVLFINAAVISIWLLGGNEEKSAEVAAHSSAEKAALPPATVMPGEKGSPPAPSSLPATQPKKNVDPVVVVKEGQGETIILDGAPAAKVSVAGNEAQQAGTIDVPPEEQAPSESAVEETISGENQVGEDQPMDAEFLDEPAEFVEEETAPQEEFRSETEAPRRAGSAVNLQEAAAAPGKDWNKNLLDILQLPPNIQAKLPEFRISAHFYSSNPASRLASVNGRVLREGQKLATGLTLREITRDGLIFTFETYTFQVEIY